MQELQFTIPEILSLLGLCQCVYILVYMLFGTGNKKSIIIPFAYFWSLGTAFFLDFSTRFIGDAFSYYDILQWGAWYIGPPLSVLVMLQVASISRPRLVSSYWVLFLIPMALFGAYIAAFQVHGCIAIDNCHMFREWLAITGLVAGVLSIMEMWKRREILETLYNKKAQSERDRYWLILMLVCMNLFFLGFMMFSLNAALDEFQARLMRTLMGLGFVYLASTSLFRIYPQAVRIMSKQDRKMISRDEMKLIEDIQRLIDLDKVYQEPAYGRSDMARELGASEAIISKLINFHFSKSLPQILNEKRVEDAKRLLRQTDASMKVIAEEVGFNSMATFNRVFKDISGIAPSEYRDKN